MTRFYWSFAALAVFLAGAVRAQDAHAILKETAEVYSNVEEYRFDADVSVSMETGGQTQAMNVNLLLAAREPRHMRVELIAPNMEVAIVSNGDSTWMYMPTENQYMVTSGGLDPEKAAASIPDLLGEYAGLADKVQEATVLREETVEVNGTVHPAYVLSVTYEPGQTTSGADSTWKTLWIDRDRHLVLREVTRTKMSSSPFGGPVDIEETSIFSRIRVGEALPDSLFAFTPPPGATRLKPEDFMAGAGGAGSGGTPQPAADFTLENLDGEAVSLESLRGKVVLINFWATWCGPCREEMPIIQRLYEAYNEDGLEVLAISVGEPLNDVIPYVEKYGYTFPVLLDPTGEIGAQYGAYSIPTSVIINQEGHIIRHFIGARPEALFRKVLRDAGLEME